MRDGIHPEYHESQVICAGCNSVFTTGSVLPELRVAICSACHPFYTGKQKMIDTEGRVDRFKKKYASVASQLSSPAKAAPAAQPAK